MGLLWNVAFHPVDLAIMAGLYVVCAFGITIGFHRYFTHRAFETRAPVKATLAILGCMTMQGPLTQWVTDHRKHHALSDQQGDPHSPHAGHGEGALATVEGLRARARRLDVHEPRDGAGPRVRHATSTRTASSARSTGSTCSGSALTLGIPFAIGYAIGGTGEARDRGPDLGRPRPDLPLPARDVQRELDLPHVRPPRLPLARRVAEQLARRAARLRRGLAQQPPRVPGLGPPRPAPLPGRPLVVGDPRPREARPGLGRAGARRRAAQRRRLQPAPA